MHQEQALIIRGQARCGGAGDTDKGRALPLSRDAGVRDTDLDQDGGPLQAMAHTGSGGTRSRDESSSLHLQSLDDG